MEPAPLRLAFLAHGGFGGSGIFASELARALVEGGHDVDLFVPDIPPRLREGSHGVRVHVHRDAEERCRAVAELHARRPIDILHAHYAWPHGELGLRARDLCAGHEPTGRRDQGSPVAVLTLHGSDVPPPYGNDPNRIRLAQLAADFDGLTAVSGWLGSRARHSIGGLNAIQEIANFIPSRFFAHQSAPKGPKGPLRVLHASTLAESKDPETLFESLDLAARRLEGIGSAPFEMRLLTEVPEASIRSVFRIHLDTKYDLSIASPTPRIESELAKTDLVLLSSRSESFSLIALEAQALGVPVLAPRVGGLPEVVRHGETGWLVDPSGPDPWPEERGSAAVEGLRAGAGASNDDPLGHGNPVAKALGRALAFFAGTPEGRRRLARMGAAGPAWVNRRFHPDRVIPEWLALYRGVLAARTPPPSPPLHRGAPTATTP